MLRAKTVNRLLPAPINEFVSNVCDKRKMHNASFLPPLLVPIDSGNGRSTIAKAIANHFHETKTLQFSSHTRRYLEFKLNGTVDGIYRIDMEIQDKATYTNEFQGIVSIVADSLLTHLNDTVGEKFFDMAERVRKNAMLIVFVPIDANQRQIELISGKLGIGTKVFEGIAYSSEYLSLLFYDVSSKYANQASVKYEDCKGRIDDYIKENVKDKTLKNVSKAAEALVYNDESLNAIYPVPEKSKKGWVF